jgi:Uma2 family endonuclease
MRRMTEQRTLSPGKYLLEVADYERLAEAGAFAGHRTELIEGDVIVVNAQFRPHAFTKTEIYDQLLLTLRALGSPLRAMAEASVYLSPHSMPLPDIVVTSEPRGSKAVPLASVALMVEVADSSLSDDLTTKQRIYARAGIPEYWVADVNGRVVHQLWAPAGDTYRERRQVAFGAPIVAATLPGVEIDTGDL